MKVILFGEDKDSITEMIMNAGFEIVEENPDFVISFGGDGTLMRSESAYPGIPKILLRNSQVCKKCSVFSNEEVLKKVMAGNYTKEKLPKLIATSKDQSILATNDIIVHNKNPRHGIRYSLTINNKPLGPVGREIIGDGIIVATPFGSTAYYRSITDSYFEIGIGLAFNNSTEQADHIVLKENSIIELTLLRGPGQVFGDNDPTEIDLENSDVVTIKLSDSYAEIVCPI